MRMSDTWGESECLCSLLPATENPNCFQGVLSACLNVYHPLLLLSATYLPLYHFRLSPP